MSSSLRRTLALRFSLTMAVALVAIALWAYLGVRGTLRDQLDASLYTTFQLQSLSLATHDRVPPVPASISDERFLQAINRLVVARDASGRIVEANRDIGLSVGLDSAALRKALAGGMALGDGVWQGGAIRFLYGPAPASAPPIAVLEVAASLARWSARAARCSSA